MTTPSSRPKPFLQIRVEDATRAYPLLGLCAGYERGSWRRKALGNWLFTHLLEFAFRFSDLKDLNSATADQMLVEAARRVYLSEKYKSRGEFGELLLHAVLRSHFNSHFAASKIFYKSADNDTVKGYDCVHVVDTYDGLELWFGEAKLYTSASDAIRDAIDELARHAGTDYLRREFALVQGKLDGPYAEQIRRMTAPEVSLDDIFSSLRVPLLITYDSKVVNSHGEASDDYKQQIEAEIRRWHSKFVDKGQALPAELVVHVILVPLKSRADLTKSLNNRLKALQGTSADEGEDDDLATDEPT
jgi:Arc/MetJ-type ribon-helix-helix transcriptional regulator